MRLVRKGIGIYTPKDIQHLVGTHGGRVPTTTKTKKNFPCFSGKTFLMLYPPLYASIILSLFRSRFSEPISFSISPNSGLIAQAIAKDVEH